MSRKKIPLDLLTVMNGPVVSQPDPNPRGVAFRFTPCEWRLLAGVEINGKNFSRKVFGRVEWFPRADFYLGIGPALLILKL